MKFSTCLYLWMYDWGMREGEKGRGISGHSSPQNKILVTKTVQECQQPFYGLHVYVYIHASYTGISHSCCDHYIRT